MSEKTAVKQHPDMGAILTARGVTFRVWAPHAEKVYVTGTFNDWSKTSTPLAREENGYWSTDVLRGKNRRRIPIFDSRTQWASSLAMTLMPGR